MISRSLIRLAIIGSLNCFLGFLANAATPWDEPFAKDVKAISAAAQAVTAQADASIVTLLEHHHFTINARGLTTMTLRRVYRILKQDSIPTWATVEQEYQPWYEDRPQLRARVISSAGPSYLIISSALTAKIPC